MGTGHESTCIGTCGRGQLRPYNFLLRQLIHKTGLHTPVPKQVPRPRNKFEREISCGFIIWNVVGGGWLAGATRDSKTRALPGHGTYPASHHPPVSPKDSCPCPNPGDMTCLGRPLLKPETKTNHVFSPPEPGSSR